MKVTVHKDLKKYDYNNVIQVSVMVSEEVKELEMPQETIIHIIQNEDGKKTKTAFRCDTSTILTVTDEATNENAPS